MASRIKAGSPLPLSEGPGAQKSPPPGNAITRKPGRARKTSTPVSEIGSEGYFDGASVEGIGSSWATVMNETEYESALRWPMSVRTFNFMRNDPQIAGLIRASTMPIRRYKWYLDTENGAPDEAAQKLADDLGIQVGLESKKNPRIRNKNRFRFDDHLRMALQMPNIYGNFWFEQVGVIDPDGFFRYTKLAPRLNNSITQFNVDPSGGLISIKQNHMLTEEIPMNKLVGYIHDQEGGNWVGRSPLRELYNSWVLKDRLLRVDVVRHERNGAGMPIIEMPQGATRSQIREANKLAQMYKVGRASGGALPYGFKLTLKGVEGNISDVLASIKFHNQEMADAWLLMFMKLGSTETGSRALGQTFVDFFSMAQETMAIWFRDIFQEHIIEDWMDWNYGTQVPAPELKFDTNESSHLSATDLANLITSGAIVIDDELEEHLRNFYNLPDPDPATARPLPTKTALNENVDITPGGGKTQTTGGDHGPVKKEPKSNTSKDPKSRNKANGKTKISTDLKAGLLPESGADRLRILAASGHPSDWPYHRLLTTIEASSGADFQEIDRRWQDALANLLREWKSVTRDQISSLVDQVEAAQTPRDLAGLSAPGLGSDILASAMHSLIETGERLARIEAATQNVHLPQADLNSLKTEATLRAQAVDALLAKNIAQSATAKALQVSESGGGGPEIAAAVRAHLDGLTGSYAQDRLGGALTQAQNAGRSAVMAQGPDGTRFYASEILDANTCANCADEDGQEFDSIAEARSDYPAGGFADCLGGDRCRGALVAVYGEEA